MGERLRKIKMSNQNNDVMKIIPSNNTTYASAFRYEGRYINGEYKVVAIPITIEFHCEFTKVEPKIVRGRNGQR